MSDRVWFIPCVFAWGALGIPAALNLHLAKADTLLFSTSDQRTGNGVPVSESNEWHLDDFVLPAGPARFISAVEVWTREAAPWSGELTYRFYEDEDSIPALQPFLTGGGLNILREQVSTPDGELGSEFRYEFELQQPLLLPSEQRYWVQIMIPRTQENASVWWQTSLSSFGLPVMRIGYSAGTQIWNPMPVNSVSFGIFGYATAGDMDGNGLLDAFDVEDFEQALSRRSEYVATHPNLDPVELGDFTGDGFLDAFDVSPFEAALAGGGGGGATVPEPGAGLVWIFCGLAATRVPVRGRGHARSVG